MDEKLLDQLYNRATSLGYKKSRNDFASLIKTDQEVFDDMFSYAQINGLVSDATQFGSMVGRFQAPYKKKEEPTTVGLPQGMVQFPQQKAPEVQLRTSPTPVGRGAQRQQAVELSAMALPSEDGLSVSAGTDQRLRPSVGMAAESTAAPRVGVLPRDVAKREAEREAATPGFIKPLLEGITPERVGMEEEYVVPSLNYQFGPLGFKFEEAGALGDYMKATSPTGETIEISLDAFTGAKEGAEADRLRRFIQSGSMKIKPIDLAKIEKQYQDENRKFVTDEEVKAETKIFSQDADALNQELKDLAKLSQELTNEYNSIQSITDPTVKDSAMKMYEVKSAAYNSRVSNAQSRQESIAQRGATLDKAIGKYTEMKSEQGTPYDLVIDALVRGGTNIVSGIADLALEAAYSVQPIDWIRGSDWIKESYIEMAQKDNIAGPEKGPDGKITREGYEKWWMGLSDDYKSDIQSRLKDQIKKEEKPVVIDAIKNAGEMFTSTTREYEQSSKQNWLSGVLLGAIESIPSFVGGGSVVKTAKLIGQSHDYMMNQMNSDPDFNDVSESEKMAVSVPLSIVVAQLERLGFRNVVGNKGLLNRLALSAIGKAGATTTAKTFGELVKNEVESGIARGALTIVGGVLAEAETGAAQQIAELGAKNIYNAIKEKKMFDLPLTVGEYAADILEAAAAEGIGGMVLGMPSAIAAANRGRGYLGVSDDVFKMFELGAQDDNIRSAYVAKLKEKVNSGEITLADAKEQLNEYRNAISLLNSVPEGLTTEDKKKAMNLLRERRGLEQQVEGKDAALVKPQQNRINAINEELTKISEDAVQKQAAGEVPVQPTTRVSEQVAEGEPQAEPQGVTAEGVQETITAPLTQEEVAPALRDVESTSKALEGIDIEPLFEKTKSTKYFRGQPVEELPEKDIFISPNEIVGKMYTKGKGVLKKLSLATSNLFDIDAKVTKDFNDRLVESWKETVKEDILIPKEILNGKYIDGNYAQELKEDPQFRRALENMGYDGLLNNFTRLKSPIPRQEIIVFNKSNVSEINANLISEAYHKAKADGSNPELVQAVESAIGKTAPEVSLKTQEVTEVTPTAPSVVEPSASPDTQAVEEGASVSIGDPEVIVKEQKGTDVKFPKTPAPLSFVTESDKIDINSLIKTIIEKKQKVWFWMADQLGRGNYYDAVIGDNHYLDAGPSFALDPENKSKGILWASGLSKKTLEGQVSKADYIFFISGSPEKAKLFNRRVLDLIAERINKTSSFEDFKNAINSFGKETNELKTIKSALNSVNSFEELSKSTKRKEFLIAIDKIGKLKTAPQGSLKELLGTFNVFVDYNDLRDGFYRENDFKQNDIMLVGKPTGVGENAPHSTYHNTILGEVVGVPDKKIDSWEIMPESVREKYRDIVEGREEKTKPIQTKVIAAETGVVRELEAPVTVKEQKGVSISNESMMEDVESRAQKDERVKSVIAAAKKVLKTLQSVIPNAQIYLHENGSDYDAFAESIGSKRKSRGIFSQTIYPDGGRIVRIDINLSNASPTTVYHEVAHAVMDTAFGDNIKLFSKFRDQLTSVLSKSTLKSLNDFASQYSEEKSYEEWLVQFAALMSSQGKQIPVSTFQKIAQVVNKIVSQITNGAIVPFKETVSKKEVIDFFNQMAESIRLGREISISKTAEAAQIKESVKEQAAQEGKPVSELPGYDKLMRDVTDTLIPNALKRKLTGQEMIDLVKRFVSKSDIYKNSDDIQRDELVRQVNGMLGEAYRNPPSARRLLGLLNDVTKITTTDKQIIIDRIKNMSLGAKSLKAAWKKASGELTKSVKDLVRTGKISVKQASAVLRRFSAVNVLDDKSVSNFIEYMDKVFKNAEYADKIAGIRKSLAKAKKNIETKLGISEDLKPMLRQMLAINPNLIPMDVLDSYVDLVNMLSERAAVLDLADVSDVTRDTANIIDAVEEEQFKAEELKEMFDDFQDKELDDNGKVDFGKTINKMIDAGIISTSDAEIMRKYRSTIMPTEVKAPMTEQEIADEKRQLQDFVQDAEIDTSNLPSRAERDAANRLAELVQTKGLESLDNQQLKNLLRVINNINNGFFPHYAQRMIKKINSANSGAELSSAAQNAKPLSFSKMYSRIKNLVTNDKNAFVTMIARNPLYYIDQVFGDFKTKTIYKNLFEPIAKAYAKFSTESNNNSKRLDKALNDVSASFKDSPAKVRLSKYKIMTYLLQLEYNSNPGVKGVAPAIDFINKTIKAIESGETNFNDYDVETLRQIVDDFAVNGQIDMQELEDSFNDAELKAIKTIQDINKDLSDKASYTANVIRGEKFVPINNYIHHSVISDGRAKDDLSGQTIIEAFSSSRMPSSRAKSLIERTPEAKAINFDPFNVTNFVSRSQLMDYYLTEPIITGRMSINVMKDGVKGKQARDIANAIGKSYEQALENVLVSSFGKTTSIDDAINFLSTQGYRAVLAGAPRFLAELLSNMSFVLSRGSKMFAEGYRLKGIVFSTLGVSVMNNLNSSQTNRVYSDNTLSGSMIDSNMLKHAAGIKNSKSKGDVANAVNQIYTRVVKKKIQNPIEMTADALISTPDKIVTRPVWFGSFSLEFKKITGTEPDFDKIAANDEAYMNANKEALQSATAKADQDVTFMSATDNPFMGILKGRDMQNQSVFAKAFNRFNNYMTRFVTYEYITARTGINALMGNGDISRKQGTALIAAVTSRMVVYSLLTQQLSNSMLSMFGDDDEEEDDKSFIQKLGQAVASSVTSLMIGRDFGNSVRTVLNIGIEEVNKRKLDFLREGDYDPYKDAIQFTIVPPDKEGKKPDANKKIVDLAASTLGPLGPSAKTGFLILRKILEAPKKTKEAKEITEKEIGIRIPLEIIGNVGLIPLYKDVRKIVLKEIYKDLGKSSKRNKLKKDLEELLLQGYPTRSDMERYDPELYKETFGEGGLNEIVNPEEVIKREIRKEMQKLEREIKDEAYQYTPKSGRKSKKKSGGGIINLD
jgi:hypothetical protein